MAHFTGLKELQNHPHKAGFDIGGKNVFTAKVGELLPVYWDMAIPSHDMEFWLILLELVPFRQLPVLVFVSILIFMQCRVIFFGNHLILL